MRCVPLAKKKRKQGLFEPKFPASRMICLLDFSKMEKLQVISGDLIVNSLSPERSGEDSGGVLEAAFLGSRT